MATLSKDKVKEIIEGAPEGTTPAGIVAGLRQEGHQLEGYDEVAQSIGVPVERKKTFTESAAGVLDTIFGGGVIGEAIGTQIAKFKATPEQREFVDPGPTAGQITGDVLRTGLNVVGLKGAGALTKGLTRGIAGREAAETLGKAELSGRARFGLRAAETSTLGGGFGVAEALRQGKPEEATKLAMQGALFGFGISAVTGVSGAVFRGATEVLPRKLYSQIFSVAKDDLRLAFQAEAKGGKLDPILAQEVLDRGLRGSSRNMAVYSFKKLNTLEEQVQTLVKDPGKKVKINKKAYISLLEELEDKFSKGAEKFFTERSTNARQLILELRKTKGSNVRMDTVLKMRRYIDNMRNTSSFRLDVNLAPKQEAYKASADGLRKALGDASPEFKSLMKEERIFIQAVDAIVDDAVKRGNRNAIGLIDIIIGGGGIASGSIVGGLTAATAVRGFQQPFTLTNIGYFLSQFGKGFNLARKEGVKAPTRVGTLRGLLESGILQEE